MFEVPTIPFTYRDVQISIDSFGVAVVSLSGLDENMTNQEFSEELEKLEIDSSRIISEL